MVRPTQRSSTSADRPRPVRGEPCTPRLTLLGSFELTCGATRLAVSVPGQRVLALLALHARPVRRSSVCAALWPESDSEKSGQNLRSVLHRLSPEVELLVGSTRDTLTLAPEVEVDLRSCTTKILALCEKPGLGAEAPVPDGGDLLPLLTADLLPDWYDEWLLVEQERYRQLRMHALEALAGRHSRAGNHAAALDAALSAVAVEPLRESAHRVVVQVHLAEGNVGEALRQYEICRRLLDEGLGIRPSAALSAMVFPPSR